MEIIYTHYDDCTPFRYNVHQLLLPVTKSLQSTKKINGTFSKWMQEPQEQVSILDTITLNGILEYYE